MSNRYEVTMHLKPFHKMRAALSSWEYGEIVNAHNSVTATELFLESDNLKAAMKKAAGIDVPLEHGGIVINVTALGEAAKK